MANWWYFSYFSQKTGFWHFMQIVSSGDNLHEMSNPVSGKNKKNISKCSQLKILPRVLSVDLYHFLDKFSCPRSDCSFSVCSICHSIKYVKKQLHKKQNLDKKKSVEWSVWNFRAFTICRFLLQFQDCKSGATDYPNHLIVRLPKSGCETAAIDYPNHLFVRLPKSGLWDWCNRLPKSHEGGSE